MRSLYFESCLAISQTLLLADIAATEKKGTEGHIHDNEQRSQ